MQTRLFLDRKTKMKHSKNRTVYFFLLQKIIFAIYERGVFEIYDAEFGRYKKSHCITQAMDRHSPKNYKNFPENQTFSKVRQHSQSGARQKELAFSAQKNDRQYSSRERPTSAPAHTRERSSSRKSPCNLHDSYERGKPRSDTGNIHYLQYAILKLESFWCNQFLVLNCNLTFSSTYKNHIIKIYLSKSVSKDSE